MRRRRKPGRQFEQLTWIQRQILLTGERPDDGPDLINLETVTDTDIQRMCAEQEIQDFGPGGAAPVWNRFREELMRDPELRSGQRPSYFYGAELHVSTPCNWWQEIDVLRTHNLLTVDECIEIESQHCELAAHDSAAADLQLDGWSGVSLNIERVQAFAAWHAWRDRPQLARIYAERARLWQQSLAI